MSQGQPIIISREAPRSRRLRRRSQQQSSCFCCLLVGVSMLMAAFVFERQMSGWLRDRHANQAVVATPAAYFPLDISTVGVSFLRYQIVPIIVRLTDNAGRPVQARSMPDVVVKRGEEIATALGDVNKLRLHWDRAENAYRCTWPVPWNAPCGLYTVEARMKLVEPGTWLWETPEETKEREKREKQEKHTKAKSQKQPPPIAGEALCVARVSFTLTGQTPPAMPPGLGAATWENDFRADHIIKPDGKIGDWRAVFDWCDFMGADTFLFRGGVTEAYTGALTDEQPFDPTNVAAIPKLAAEAHRHSLKFGTWAAAYATYPANAKSNRRKPDYHFAQDISRSTGQTRDLDFISLLDERRIKHLAEFFAKIQADPNVDFLGLDYMRSDKGGWEMVDRFAQEMPLELPAKWDSWTQTQRWQYVAGKVELDWQKDAKFYEHWNWFRAHLVATNLSKIIQQGKITKPMWIFSLGWQHGRQHGQDPIMFTDAGASMLFPMLYQIRNRAMYDLMVRDWHKYIAYGQANIVPGDQVDFNWHQKTLDPAAPEELYYRMVTAHRQYLQGGLTQGLFWHDISRAAIWGARGPYPGTEWALAGGAAFTACRQDWNVYPLRAEMIVPRQVPISAVTDAQVVVINSSDTQLRNVAVTMADTPGVSFTQKQFALSGLLAKQKTVITVPFRITGADQARANRFMVCARVTWPRADYGKQFRRDLPPLLIVMKYTNGK